MHFQVLARIVVNTDMNEEQIALAFAALSRRSLDFMVHLPIPDNHHFFFFASGQPNPDFDARCSLYAEFARPGAGALPAQACQLVAIEPYFLSANCYPEIQKELNRLTVIRNGKKNVEIRPVYLVAFYSTFIPGSIPGIVRIISGCFLINHAALTIATDPGNSGAACGALNDFGVHGSVRHFGDH